MSAITDSDRALYAAVKADPAAFALLRYKARWEAITLYHVLREYGDPRTWPAYKRATPCSCMLAAEARACDCPR